MVWVLRLPCRSGTHNSVILWTLNITNYDNECLSHSPGDWPPDPIQRAERTIYPFRSRRPDCRPFPLHPVVLLSCSGLVVRRDCPGRWHGCLVGMYWFQPEIWGPWPQKIKGPTATATLHPVSKPPMFHQLKL